MRSRCLVRAGAVCGLIILALAGVAAAQSQADVARQLRVADAEQDRIRIGDP